jgi:NAD(P)-dependent dehydrogenase (short-subunit alcohol dehydrogenase family)
VAVTEFGGVDIPFNNVGITRHGWVDELAEDEWDDAVATNLTGIFLACRYAIPEMRRRGSGAIINTASILAHRNRPLTASYAATKGGVLALTGAIAIDHAAEGIRCNSISPGTIDTPLMRIDAAGADRLLEDWAQHQSVGWARPRRWRRSWSTLPAMTPRS